MKRWKRMISVALTGLLIGSTLASCGGNQNQTETAGEADVWVGRGVHTAKVEATNDYIVKNDRTDYVLLLPEEPKKYETLAADLINQYMELSLGVTFPVVYSTGAETAESGKYISIGDTTLMRSSGISVSEEKFGATGFRIVTKGNDIYVSGARKGYRYGTYYGAQEFLSLTMDWEAYSYDEVQYNVLQDLKLSKYDVVEIPDFEYRHIRTQLLQDNIEYMNLMRLESHLEYELPIGSGHNHLKWLPYSTYGTLHPEWYVMETKEGGVKAPIALCLSNEEMTSAFVNVLVEWFHEYPDCDMALSGMSDSAIYCECENCEAWRQENNTTVSGQLIDFANRLCRQTNAILQQTEPDRVISIKTFGYSYGTFPPVHAEKGKWVPDSPLVLADPNVFVYFAPIFMNWSEAITSPENQTFKDYLDGWSVICHDNNIDVYQYNTNYNNILCMHKNFDTEARTLRAFSDAGATRMDMVHHGTRGQAGMIELRNYVHAKLMWNLNLNYNDLAYEFIEHYYGPAADDIAEMYQKQTSYYEYLHSRTDTPETPRLSGGLRVGIMDAKYWSFSYVDNIKNVMEHAYESIAYLEEKDKAAHSKYYWRIGSAYMENLLMQMQLYQTNYGKEYTYYVIDLMSSIASHCGLTQTAESNSSRLSTFYAKWRATYE